MTDKVTIQPKSKPEKTTISISGETSERLEICHLLALGITAPESACHTCNLHCLDKASVHQVRTTAKVGEIALGICGDGTILQVLLNMLAQIGRASCRERV